MKRSTIISLILFVLLLSACSQSDADDVESVPTLVATAVPVEDANNALSPVEADDTVTNTGDSSGADTAVDTTSGNESTTAGADSTDLGNILLYDEPVDTNYLTTMEFSTTVIEADGTETFGRVYAEGTRTVAPEASTLTFTTEGSAGGGLGDTFTVTQIEGTNYYLFPPNNCMILAAGESGFDNPFEVLLDTGGFLTGTAERVLPDEVINGVLSYHYKIMGDNVNSLAVSQTNEADLYVAQDGSYVTRLLVTGVGATELLSGNPGVESEIYYELNFTPTDEPIQISPPAGCDEIAESEYPMLDDAANINSMSGIFTYETSQSFDNVLAFYKTEMAAAGWTLAQEIVQSPVATLTFTGSDGTVQINIAPGTTPGTILVAIVSLS